MNLACSTRQVAGLLMLVFACSPLDRIPVEDVLFLISCCSNLRGSVVRQLCDCTKYEASSRPLARVAWELFILHTCAWAALAWHGSAHTHMGRAAQTRAKESIKGGSARRGQVRRVHLTLSAEPWLKTRRTECVIPLDIVASTSQNEAAVMVQGVVVFVPGTYRTTRSNSTVESELFLRYYGMPFDFYTY